MAEKDKKPDVPSLPSLFEGMMEDLFGNINPWKTTETVKTEVAKEPSLAEAKRTYRTDVDATGLNIEVDVPGVSHADITLWRQGNVLIVKGKKSARDFVHRYTIGFEYDIRHTTATLSLGVLRVRIAKSAHPEPVMIPIKMT